MDTLSVERLDSISLVKLNRGITNPLNLECLEELNEAVNEARAAPEVRGLVLGSNSTKFFSIGFDIPALFGLLRDEFRVFYRTFNRVSMNLYTLPKPTVASLPGHAVAGGCILALCCDYRFIAEGRSKMGLNEVKLGVPVPYLADRIMHALVGTRRARVMMEGGEFVRPEESLKMGLVDRILPADQVLDESLNKARELGALPPLGYETIKRHRVMGIEAEVKGRPVEMEELFLDCWYSDAAREQLKAALEKY